MGVKAMVRAEFFNGILPQEWPLLKDGALERQVTPHWKSWVPRFTAAGNPRIEKGGGM